MPLAFALSLAAAPATAAELDRIAQPVQDDGRLENPLPHVSTPIDQMVKGLHRLRLRPAVDSFDVRETSRRPPRADTE